MVLRLSRARRAPRDRERGRGCVRAFGLVTVSRGPDETTDDDRAALFRTSWENQ